MKTRVFALLPRMGTVLALFLIGAKLHAQERLTLSECLEKAMAHHPLAQQDGLLTEQWQLQDEALKKDRLPQISLNARATYQSEVTRLPIAVPNLSVPSPHKDQYRATLDLDQSLYNGRRTQWQLQQKEAASEVARQQVAVELYGLKGRVNQLYHAILLAQQNQVLLSAKAEQLQARLQEIQAGVAQGTQLASAAEVLEAELLTLKQQERALYFSKEGLLHQLSLLIGTELPSHALLDDRPLRGTATEGDMRPEIRLFDLQRQAIDQSENLLHTQLLPTLDAFAQAGYGNPGLNQLDNHFDSFYMAGLRLHWGFFDWNRTKKQQDALKIDKDLVDTREQAFELETRTQLADIRSEIDKLQELIGFDKEIVTLREKVLQTADAQLRHGVITTSAYTVPFTDLYEAELTQTLHLIQLRMQEAQYQITAGGNALDNP